MAEERARLQGVQAKHLDRLLAWPNVTAVDINKRTVGGKETDQLCLVVWVRSKKPESEIAAKEILPKEIDGVPVDVYEGEASLGEGFSWPHSSSGEEETSSEDGQTPLWIAESEGDLQVATYYIDALADIFGQGISIATPDGNLPMVTRLINAGADLEAKNNGQGDVRDAAAQDLHKLRPLGTLRGGDSLAPDTADYVGTLGYFVKKNGAVGVLSNAHVMGSEGTKLISPAKCDGGDPITDYIGTVESSVVTTVVDCGYAPLREKITTFRLKDRTSVTGTEAARVGTLTRFYGRTSGSVKSGHVLSVNWSGTINGRQFRNQILFSERVKEGDSGSLLLNRENDKAIGLNFAESAAGYGLANPIADVLSALGVTIAIR